MNPFASPRIAAFARVLLVATGCTLLASCGSGAVSGSAPVNDPARITILPATATLYAGQPTTFQVSGGTGTYIATSSDQAVIPLSGTLPRNTFTVIPAAVAADTPVTITVRDTGTTPLANATLTVRPNTVSNNITITPSATQGGGCAPAICSGGDAEVSVQLVQNGQPLAFRAVRFEATSGDFRFITSQPGNPEATDLTTTVLTDEAGRARVRVRVASTAQNQTAILRVVDVDSGAFQTSSFTIAQSTGTSPGFFASPSAVTFSGPNTQECANSGAADIAIFGGTPPYTIAPVGTPFSLSQTVVAQSGDSFSVFPRGVCVAEPGLPVTIRDAAGRTTTVQVANVLGTLAVPPLAVAPTEVTLTACNSFASVSVAGGTGQYVVNSGNSAVSARLANNSTIVIGRNPGATPPATTSVGVSSGSEVRTITVTLTGGALTRCDGGPFTVNPQGAVLDSCSPVTLVASGGSGSYTALSGTSSVVVAVSGANITVRRATGSSAAFNSQISVSDGSTAVTVPVSGPALPAACS